MSAYEGPGTVGTADALHATVPSRNEIHKTRWRRTPAAQMTAAPESSAASAPPAAPKPTSESHVTSRTPFTLLLLGLRGPTLY